MDMDLFNHHKYLCVYHMPLNRDSYIVAKYQYNFLIFFKLRALKIMYYSQTYSNTIIIKNSKVLYIVFNKSFTFYIVKN